MALPRPQAPQDYLSQLWNIVLGRRLGDGDSWLLGPIGEVGGIADRYVDRLAEAEGLSVHRNAPGSGLMEGFDAFPQARDRVDPRIDAFYRHTIDFDFDVWTEWQGGFGVLARLVYRLFSRRIEQLNLPQGSLDTAYGMRSEIVTLRDASGRLRYTVWFRRLKKTGEVVYSGVYSHCTLPSGERCVKVVFPLPQGSATVVLRLRVDPAGNLELRSEGKGYGEPGFYFLVEDRKGGLWQHYLRSFRERIFVFVDGEGDLRTDHSMSVWGLRAYDLHYRMHRKSGSETPAVEPPGR